MPRHRFDQSLNRGFTVVELLMGLAVSGVVALVASGLFKAGLLTFHYAVRQNHALTAGRKALAGDGSRHGMVWMSQGAASVAGLDASSLAVSPPGALSTTFHVHGEGLYRSQLDVPVMHAEGVSAVALHYYNLDDGGRIVASTAPASASLVTALVSVHGKSPRRKTYHFFSGARLRNHP